MKKGHRYDLNLIYAQFYNDQGTGYIDFNGTKVLADNDYKDKKYTESVTPKEDMNYTITVSFTTIYPGNAYFKIGYDTKNGSGITDTPLEFQAPVVSPAPEAGSNNIIGTAYKGNNVVATDSAGKEIGSATVSDDGTFEIKTTRPLIYNETLKIIQKNDSATSPAATVKVVDTQTPAAPVLNKITDEDLNVSGTAKPDSTVFVTFDLGDSKQHTYEGTTKSDGTFTINLDRTFPGQTKVTAYVTDEAGNKSKSTSAKVEFAKSLNIVLTHKISSIDTVVSGTSSRPNCQITIQAGDRVYNGTSDSSGKFQIPIDKYVAGTDYTIKAVDPSDPEKPVSKTDKVLPRIPALTTTESGVKVLTGEADPNAQITLTLTRGKDTFNFTATADAQGNFSIPLKTTDGKELTLTIEDELTYTATLKALGLTSDQGSSKIYTR